ncbi:cleft lip and palate associated transmembrane protein [Fomitopsis serialis]|uniref:cleft lip and palate associated transmembrane protein n=1 Tax=Fomitopsis serialis TaxID=139415 RepID=UPI0020073C52|nr:cleft lip and palate associated transmembrane protein [Neoantrodia serialis]KAH9938336.1 cleft lip and palate associated transmembrane protein [Neoantrodia serialis]
MSSADAAPRQAQANAAPAVQEESTWRRMWSMAQQLLIMYLVMQVATKFFAPKQPDAAAPSTATQDDSHTAQQGSKGVAAQQATPGWSLGIPLAMHVYFSTSPDSADVFANQWTSDRGSSKNKLPNFVWDNITYGDFKESRTVDLMLDLPLSVQHNGSLWADIYLVKDGASPDPSKSNYDTRAVHHARKLLTRYLPKTKARKEKNLLGGGQEENAGELEEPQQADVIVSHWHPNLTLALVSDATAVPITKLPEPVARHVEVYAETDQSGTRVVYKPIVYPNDFWLLRSQFIEINSTTPRLPLQVTFQPLSYWKFQIFATMTQGFDEAAKQQGGASGAELDEIKRMLVETNPWFLGLTALVSVLHVVFEMLAFSSDVSHWRQKQELVGVSVRSIVTNVVVQIIILLYLVDNNEQTSWMILMGSGVGVLIEAWKVASVPYVILRFSELDRHVLSEDEKKTQEYDKLAFRYVSYFTIPCLAGYTVYSLLYETHRGWYSFVISTLTSFVYMFGFAQLIPQLIINYKLKSVAHMPMKAMIYKSLSTVVDDLFAFCIKMPVLHRLACFRDDVVFLVFIYQRWIYRIDPKRVNEYGQVMASEVDAVQAKGGKEDAETKKNK